MKSLIFFLDFSWFVIYLLFHELDLFFILFLI